MVHDRNESIVRQVAQLHRMRGRRRRRWWLPRPQPPPHQSRARRSLSLHHHEISQVGHVSLRSAVLLFRQLEQMDSSYSSVS